MPERRRRRGRQARQAEQEQADQDAQPDQGPDPKSVRVGGPVLEQLLEEMRRLRRASDPDDEERQNRGQIVPIVPQNGQQLIAAGGSFEFELENIPRVKKLVVDFPDEVEFELIVDGATLLNAEDGQGRGGEFEYPVPKNIDKVEVEGTNNASIEQDVGAWAGVVL